jgi:hypothetical protein
VYIIPPAGAVPPEVIFWLLQHPEVLVGGDLDILCLTGDELNRKPEAFDQGGIVCTNPPLLKGPGVGLGYYVPGKALRGLDGIETGTVQGLHSIASLFFDSVSYWQSRNSSSGSGVQRCDHGLDELGADKGTGCIVNKDMGTFWRQTPQCFGHRFLSGRPAGAADTFHPEGVDSPQFMQFGPAYLELVQGKGDDQTVHSGH